jgi:hypothetical protein
MITAGNDMHNTNSLALLFITKIITKDNKNANIASLEAIKAKHEKPMPININVSKRIKLIIRDLVIDINKIKLKQIMVGI